MMQCKKMKCLTYPICLNKEIIDCEILRKYYLETLRENGGLANRVSKTWGSIRVVLPMVSTILGPLETNYGTATKTIHNRVIDRVIDRVVKC